MSPYLTKAASRLSALTGLMSTSSAPEALKKAMSADTALPGGGWQCEEEGEEEGEEGRLEEGVDEGEKAGE
jgi:hypothetical protein